RDDALERGVGVDGRVDGVALLGQPLLQELRDPLLVLDDEDLHAPSPGWSSGPGSPRRVFMKETMKTAPAPAANPAANEEGGGGVAKATTAPTARSPRRSGRETSIGGTDGIIEERRGYYDRLKNRRIGPCRDPPEPSWGCPPRWRAPGRARAPSP